MSYRPGKIPAKLTEKEREKFPEFDGSKFPILTKSQARKNPPTTQFWLNDGKGNIDLVNPKLKIEKTNSLVTPTDEQFAEFAPDYVKGDDPNRFIIAGKRKSKVVLGRNNIEYTYDQYKKMTANKAERLGLPRTYSGWDAAPAHRWLIDTTKD